MGCKAPNLSKIDANVEPLARSLNRKQSAFCFWLRLYAVHMTGDQSPRQRIRVAVQSLHKDLDSQPILQGLAQAPLHGEAAYLRSLRFLLPYWQTFAHFHPAGQRYYRALTQDIDEPDSVFPVHPDLNRRPNAFHYVMWGSTLGGRVLLKQVPDHWPQAFLSCCAKGELPPPDFDQLAYRDVVAAKEIFSHLLKEASRDVQGSVALDCC